MSAPFCESRSSGSLPNSLRREASRTPRVFCQLPTCFRRSWHASRRAVSSPSAKRRLSERFGKEPGKKGHSRPRGRAPSGMLDEMTAEAATANPHRQLTEPQRRAAGTTTTTRDPGSRPVRPRDPRRPPRARSASLHRPSWKSHRAYVHDRRQRRRLLRRSRHTWAGRHPVATGALAALVLLTPLWVSLGGALTNPALGLSVPARFAEWLRDNGGGSVVNTAENWWYSHHQPPVGGRPLAAALPSAATHPRCRDGRETRFSCSPPGTDSAHAIRQSRPAGRRQLETRRPPRTGHPGCLRDVPPARCGAHKRRGRDRLDGHKALVGDLVLGQLHSRRGPLHLHGADPAERGQLARGGVQRRVPDAGRQRRLLHPGPDDHPSRAPARRRS